MVKKSVIFLYFFLMLVLLSLAVTSCRSVKYVPVETVRHDSVYFNKVLTDSVYVMDSVLVVKGDTVTEYRYRYVYRYKDKTDTMFVSWVDTVSVPYPVEKELNRWERFKVDFGGFALVLLALTIVVGAACVLKLKK